MSIYQALKYFDNQLIQKFKTFLNIENIDFNKRFMTTNS